MPSLAIVTSPPSNVPAALSSFVGRAVELAEAARRLETSRLLTLVGAGGAGKTRLARELAGAAEARSALDLVAWVELAPLAPGAQVAPTVASHLGASGAPAALAAAVGRRKVLLVLDNCEHVAAGTAALVDGLLRACPGLSVLATSREPLGVEGEATFRVPPLAVPPDAGDRSPAPPDLLRYEAVQLLVERIRSQDPAFALTASSAGPVVALARGLDGLPLALELAAAASAALGVKEVAARLGDALGLLGGGPRGAPGRQRTLRALLDWSHDLLDREERTLLARLSAFRSPASLDDVEEVCGAAPLDGACAVFEPLASLVRRSLVERREEDGEPRFALLETIRQYAAERLEGSGDEACARDRHARWVARAVECDERLATSPARAAALARTLRLRDDMSAALTWATRPDGEAPVALNIAGALSWCWAAAGSWDVGRRWVAAALAVADRTGIADPERPLEEKIALSRTLHAGLTLDWLVNEPQLAGVRSARALALVRSVPDDSGLEPALRLKVARWRALTLERVGLWVAAGERDRAGAEAHLAEALAAARASGDAWVEAWVLARRALVRLSAGELALVEADGLAADAQLAALGDRWARSMVKESLGEAARLGGRLAEAARLGREAAALLREDPDPAWFLARALELLAAVATGEAPGAPVDAARAAAAARLLGAVEGLRTRSGTAANPATVARRDRAAGAARLALGEADFTAALEAGSRLGTAEAFDLAAHAEVVPAGNAGAVPGARAVPPAAPAQRALLAPALRVLAFGPLHVERGGVPLAPADWRAAKTRELFLYLLVHPPRSKEEVALALWPDAGEAQARNLMHVTLHRLRAALGAKGWVAFEGGAYRFARPAPGDPEAPVLDCDLDAVRAASAAAQRAVRTGERVDPSRRAGWRTDLERATRGRLGEGTGAGEWLDAHERAAAAAWSQGVEAVAALASADGVHGEAVAMLEALVGREPLRERAHRALLAAYVAGGEPARALAHYGKLEALLSRELGVRPARETAALVAHLRR